MNDLQLDDRLRGFFAPLAAEDPPSSLWARIDAIPDQPPTPGPLAFLRSRSVRVLILAALLAALALSVAFIVGSQHLRSPLQTGVIVFDSEGHIFLADADGTHRRQLTSGPATDFSPTVSPDGSKLAFWSQSVVEPAGSGPSKTAPTSLMVVELDGSHPRALVDGLAYPDWAGPQWSPDGQRLAYASHDVSPGGGPPAGIAVMSPDGGDAIQVVMGGDIDMNPIWSPDSHVLAYALGGALHLASRDGTHDQVLVSAAVQAAERWSPDGSRIAFSGGGACCGPIADTWTVNRDGSNLHPITDLSASEVFGGWSADGSATVISRRDTDQSWIVMIADADGLNERRLADSGLTGAAHWSNDGALLLAQSADGLLILDPTGVKPPILIAAHDALGVSGHGPGPVTPDHTLAPDPAQLPVTGSSSSTSLTRRATSGFSLPFTFDSAALPDLQDGNPDPWAIWSGAAPSSHTYEVVAADYNEGLTTFSNAKLYADPCHPSRGFADTGTSADAMAAALGTLPGLAVGDPRPISVDGFSGVSLDFHTTTAGAGCERPNTFSLLQADPGIDDTYVLVNGPWSTELGSLVPRVVQLDGSIWARWLVLDVRGTRVVFEAWTAWSPADDTLASLEHVVESIDFQ